MGVTATIFLFVPEEPDIDPADQSSVLVTYKNVVCVSCLPAVRTLLVCLLTLKVGRRQSESANYIIKFSAVY